jgi:hypothetical protein
MRKKGTAKDLGRSGWSVFCAGGRGWRRGARSLLERRGQVSQHRARGAYRGGGRDSSWRVAQRGDVSASSPPLRNHSHVTGPRWSHDPPPSSVSVLSRLRCKDVRVKGSSPRRAGTRPGQPANRSQSVYPAGHLQPTVARCKAGLTGATLLMRLQWSRDLWPCSKGRVPHSHSDCYNRGCSLAEPGRSTSLSLSRVVSGRGFFFLYTNGSQCSCAFQSVWARDPRPHVWFRAYNPGSPCSGAVVFVASLEE